MGTQWQQCQATAHNTLNGMNEDSSKEQSRSSSSSSSGSGKQRSRWSRRHDNKEASSSGGDGDDGAEGARWQAADAHVLFAATRWGMTMETVAEVEQEMERRLQKELLPKRVLSGRVELRDAILPRGAEDFACFVSLYDEVCAHVCVRETGQRAADDGQRAGRESIVRETGQRAADDGQRAGRESIVRETGQRAADDGQRAGRESIVRETGQRAADDGQRAGRESDVRETGQRAADDGQRAGRESDVRETGQRATDDGQRAGRETESDVRETGQRAADDGQRAGREGTGQRAEKAFSGETSQEGWTDPPLERLVRQLQRKMAGFVRARILEAHDFLRAVSYADEKGVISETKKRRLVRVNDMLRPWVSILAKVTNHTQLNRAQEIWSNQREIPVPEMGKAIVYARLNLHTQHLYIGETQAWDNRVKQHFIACYKHSDHCQQRCHGCGEHRKYTMHRACAPHAWIMIPLYECEGKHEALRLERKLVKRWKPSLNQGDRPFWLLKQAYATEFKRGRKQQRDRKPPWKNRRPERIAQLRQLPALTTYETDTSKHLDIGEILNRHPEGIRIKVTTGLMDLTKWSTVRQKWGSSYVKLQLPEGGRESTLLSLWRIDKRMDEFHAWIKPHKTEREIVSREELIKEVEKLEETLESCSEENLAFYWRTRNNLDKKEKIKYRQIIWNELERRYEGLTRVPITVRIPYFKKLRGDLVRRAICDRISEQEWPSYIKEWHCTRLKIVTASQPSISEIMTNVNKPWYEHHKSLCRCKEVKNRLKELGYTGAVPRTDGHMLFTGREYDGPGRAALNVCASNVPEQTAWDLKRAWEKTREQLPKAMQGTQTQWNNTLHKVCVITAREGGKRDASFPATRDVYKLRKAINGLVVGPLDKNNGELWACCPVLYRRALRTMYCAETGYEKVNEPAKPRPIDTTAYWLVEGHPPGFSPWCKKGRRKERKKTDGGKTNIAQETVKLWHEHYKRKGWTRYAPFNTRGGFNRPYVLFKSKNMDPKVREAKWKKARPIAPGTGHPMRKLLRLVGRAWSFATAKMEGEHFVMRHGGQVPNFLREAEKLREYGEIGAIIRDITGCFPNMPKETIRFALRKIARDFKQQHGYEGVTVPRWSKTKPCSWKEPKTKGEIHISWEILLDVMEFSLDNALIEAPEGGTLLRQVAGIPMGDPISPGMTIGTCAWMENEWMSSLSRADKEMFRAKRYMDDILMIYSKNPSWDHERFLKDFEKSECYQAPLELEEGKPGTFLETTFELQENGTFRHWLKNENKRGEAPKIWRYSDFRSHGKFEHKRALITGRMRAVHSMASDKEALRDSALQKLEEFRRLGFPPGLLRGVCNFMGATTGEGAWIGVRNALD